ncbi:hypothetical protein CROQUDRAFT_73896 [Cronartium quercuum f. sp. fusiforme G11]|uniref:Glutamate--tRNA ligase, mitochondrial n=1 Tax=Cronartium quercuum f. sp. fusiforme G11 TaxID=708437 RepID=A0A9P6TFB0_9BASI|nr:hypothetical protein CROQUDRAFT_73896 [Cronartium quercuum f. sp. fusiforme G11]
MNSSRLAFARWCDLRPSFLGSSSRRSRVRAHTRRAHGQAPVRLRFAPSPTGFLHLGGLRTALFNHLLARNLRGQWVLRIEDTDRTRYVEGALESLIKTLKWAGLSYDEGPDRPGSFGPYIQSERKSIYHAHVKRLSESGQAYPCFCTSERLSAMREGFRRAGSHMLYDRTCHSLSQAEAQERISNGVSHVIRLLQNSDEPVECDDLVYGSLNFLNQTQDDVILVKADGMPTYHLANVVDDHEMRISHVLRGEEWLSSTPKHLLLYRAFGFEPPSFVHLPLLVNADGSKLSKRSGDVRVEDFIAKGYEPEALLNFVALMGMNHNRTHSATSKVDEVHKSSDIMTMDEMISRFSIESIGKHRSTMSQPKLDFLNQQYLSRQITSSDPQQIANLISRARVLLSLNAEDEIQHSNAYLQRVMYLMRDRLHVFSDLKYLAEYFFRLPDLTSPEACAMRTSIPTQTYDTAIKFVHRALESIPDLKDEFRRENISIKIQDGLKEDPTMKAKTWMMAIRHAITGRKIGAGMAETIEVLGKRRTLDRLAAAIEIIPVGK